MEVVQGATTFYWDREDSGKMRDARASADEEKFSHEKDDPDRTSVTNLCVDSERLRSATSPRLRPPGRGRERQKAPDF